MWPIKMSIQDIEKWHLCKKYKLWNSCKYTILRPCYLHCVSFKTVLQTLVIVCIYYVVSLTFDNQLYHVLFWFSWYNVRNTAVESPSHTIFTTYLIFSFLSMFIGPNYVVCPIDHAISPSKRNYLKLYGVQYERKSVIQFLIIIIIVTMPHHGYLS